MTQFLAEWALRSSILIVCGALLIRALRVKDPSLRLAAWTAILCGSLAIPALTAVLPKLPIAVMRVATVRVEAPVIVHDDTPPPVRPVPRPDAQPDRPHPSVSPGSGAVPATPNPNTQVDRPSPSVSPSSEAAPAAPNSNIPVERSSAGISKHFDWGIVAVMVYVVVAIVLLLRLGFGLAISLRLLRRSRVTGQATEGIQIRESDRVTAPVALGIVRPAIVLPGDWRQWDSAKMKAVLAHERSHIRRHDPAVQLLSAIHRILLWPTPLSWFLHRQIVRVAEEVCDDAAVAVTRDRTLYAEVLLDFMRRGVWRPSWQGVPISRYGLADMRIHRILDGTALSRGVTRWGLAAILALGLPLAYLAATAQPQSEPQKQLTPLQIAGKPTVPGALPPTPAPAGGQDRITAILIRGNIVVPTSTLLKSISLHSGDICDPARIERDVTALKNTGLLDGVGAQLYDAPAGTNAGKLLIFNVHEKPARIPDRIAGIIIRGNDRIPASTVRKSIAIHSGDIYDPAQIDRAVAALKNTGYDVRVETSDDPTGTKGGTMVIFYVREKNNAATEPQPAAVQPAENPSPAVAAGEIEKRVNLGNFHLGRGEFDDAIASYEEALRLDPSNFEIRQKLRGAIKACSKEEALLHEGLRCGAISPPLTPSPALDLETQKRITMGDFHRGRGEYDDAIAAYAEGLQLDPSNTQLRQKLDATILACKKEVAILNDGFKCREPQPPIGARQHAQTIEVLTAEQATLKIVTVPPGAEVLIDGKSYGPSPVRAYLAAGKHSYTLERPGMSPYNSTATLRSGGIITRTISFGATVTNPQPAGPAVDTREVQAKITMGDFHLMRGEYDDAIASYEAGLQLDPSNPILHQKLHSAIRACQKANSILNEGMDCAEPGPVVKLIPSGNFARWNAPLTKGQMVPDNSIEGGLKPVGSLTVPPSPNAPPQAFVVFMIDIDPNGNVTPGRKVSDDHDLAPQVMAAAKGWKFEPPTVNNEAVSTSIQVLVVF